MIPPRWSDRSLNGAKKRAKKVGYSCGNTRSPSSSVCFRPAAALWTSLDQLNQSLAQTLLHLSKLHEGDPENYASAVKYISSLQPVQVSSNNKTFMHSSLIYQMISGSPTRGNHLVKNLLSKHSSKLTKSHKLVCFPRASRGTPSHSFIFSLTR